MEEKRYEWVDIAKGIGIILVVYGHTLRGVENANLSLNKDFFYVNDSSIYSFHMPLFFVLSGLFFVKSLNKYNFKKLLIEKTKTILYPFVIWSILQTSIEIILSNFTNGQIGIDSLFTAIIIPRAQFWFLHALFFIFIVNILLHYFFKSKWLIISFTISIIYYFHPINLSIFSNTFHNLLFFNLGVIIFTFFIEKQKQKETFNSIYLILSGVIFIIAEYLYIFKDIHFLGFSLVLAILGVIFTVALSSIISKKTDLLAVNLSSLGKYSLYIYILHILVGSGTRIILLRFFHVDNALIHIFLGTLLGVAIPYLITLKFQNNKLYKNLFSLS